MKIRRIDFAPDDWLAGTVELKPYDRGVYITICALIYSRGEAIGTELIRRHLSVHGNALSASLARLAAAGKIVRNGSEIAQKRCGNELEIAQKRLRKWLEIHPEYSENNDVTLARPRARDAPVRKRNKKDIRSKDSDSLPREAARPSAAEIVEVDRLIAETLQAVKSRTATPYVGKRDQWLNNLAGFVAEQFAGDARLEAWQAIEDARSAGTREATPSHTRRALDDIDKLMRTAAQYAEAAE